MFVTVIRRRLGALALAMLALGFPAALGEPLSIVTSEGSHVFDVEFAGTPAERSRGLMYRRELAEDGGMLFDFGKPGPVSMWMKNTFISLDMLFIRPDGTIHRIERRTPPFSLESISSRGDVSAVLEVVGGTTDRLGIRPGDEVRHPMFGNAEK